MTIKQYCLSSYEFSSYFMKWTNIIIRKRNKEFWNNIKVNDIIEFSNKYNETKFTVQITNVSIINSLEDYINKYNYLKIYPNAISPIQALRYLKIKLNYYLKQEINVIEFKLIKC